MDYQFSKNAPTSYPTGRLLAKIDLGLAAYAITVVGGLLIVLTFSPDTLESYAAKNPEQKDINHFLALPESEQVTILGIFLGWYIFELFLSLLLFFGTKMLSLPPLKFWMIFTILNCFFGLGALVPIYLFIDNKPLFIVGVMVMYMYKLFCIYTMDMFLREIVGRRKAAAMMLALG